MLEGKSEKSFEIIMGRAGTGKTYSCLSEMAEKMRGEPLGAPLIIIVPEHETYRVEKELCDLMQDKGRGFMRAYVLGFRRLAYQVFAFDGLKQEKEISELGRQLRIKRILMTNEFKSFGRGAKQPGFISEISSLLVELRSYGVIDRYRELKACEGFSKEAATVWQKLADMDELSAQYDSLLRDAEDGTPLYSDEYRLMQRLLTAIPGSSFFEGAEVWVDGFTFFEPMEQAVLKAIMDRGCPIHLSITGDKKGKQEELSIFHRQQDTCRRLTSDREKYALGNPSSWVVLSDNKRFSEGNSAFQLLEEQLFSFKPVSNENKEELDLSGICLVEAANRRREIELAAADIRRLCREKKYHYSDIAIITRDMEEYGFLLTRVLKDYDIPCYCDEKISAIDHPLAELLGSVLQIFTGSRGGWRYEDVFRALKSGFFAPEPDEIDLLENYAVEFGIRGKSRWTTDAPWEAYRGRKEGEAPSEAQQEYLSRINDIRYRAAAPLKHLDSVLKNGGLSVREISSALYGFMTELGVQQKLDMWAREESEAGRQENARRHERMWNQVIALLEEISQALGDNILDENPVECLKAYRQLLMDGIGRINFSLVPPGIDYVTITSLDNNSLDNIKAIYILGVNAGIMPRGGDTCGFLSREERQQVNELLEVSMPNVKMEDQSLRERYTLYRAFTRMREYLWVSYALMDGGGNALMPSEIISRIYDVLPGIKKKRLSVDDLGLLQIGEQEAPHKDENDIVCKEGAKLHSWQLADSRQAVIKLAGALREIKERTVLTSRSGQGKTSEGGNYDNAVGLTEAEMMWTSVYKAVHEKTDGKLFEKLKRSLFANGSTNLEPELAHKLYLKEKGGNRYISGSVSSIESFNSCPFRYFAQRGLKLRNREEYGFGVADKGVLLHSVMENFIGGLLKKTIDIDNWDSEKLADELTENAAADVRNRILMQDDRMRGLLKRIKTTARVAIDRLKELSVDESQGKFSPCGVELRFGSNNNDTAMDGRKISTAACRLKLEEDITLRLTGVIDRLDVMKDEEGKEYVLVIDYKTGEKTLSLIDLNDGQSLQLITYLLLAKSLKGSKEKITLMPAGACYFHIFNPSVDGEKLAIKKLIENNPAASRNEIVYREAEEDHRKMLKFSGWSIPDSEISGTTTKSAEFFDRVCELAEDRLILAGREILSGKIAVNPYRGEHKDACKYCDYRDVCGFDEKVEGYFTRRPDRRDDKELEELLMDGALFRADRKTKDERGHQ